MALRNDLRMISASDDSAKMMKQVLANHAPAGHEVDVRPILSIIEDIFRRATATPSNIDGVPNGKREHMDALHDNKSLAAFSTPEPLSDIIHKICCEISCKGGGDALATTMALFKTLSSYSWDAKMVLSLAAFAVNYGEFWLVAQLCTQNSLANSVAVLKQLPEIPTGYDALKPQFDELNNLIGAMLDLTNCIVEFKQLPSRYISNDGKAMSMDQDHYHAAYWTFRSIVACNSRILSFRGLYTPSTTHELELSTLTYKVSNIHVSENLTKQIEFWRQQIDKIRQIEEYNNLVRILGKHNRDNIKVLRALIYAEDLVDDFYLCKQVQIHVLKKKHVLLLISRPDDISQEEILFLSNMYKDLKESKECRIVWLPIVDGSIDRQQALDKFKNLQKRMPWYSIQDPAMIQPAVIKYVKEEWKYSKKAIIVSVDPQGRILNQNAFHTLWIWGISAFPFTAETEEALWKEKPWTLELLVGDIDATILEWMKEERFICLYGGNDEAWIRKFRNSAKDVASKAQINWGMAYVGKKNAKKRLEEISSSITKTESSHIVIDATKMWFFWARLERMLYWKLQHGMSVEKDNIMREMMTLLSFDGSPWLSCLDSSAGSRVYAKLAVRSGLPRLLDLEPELALCLLPVNLTSRMTVLSRMSRIFLLLFPRAHARALRDIPWGLRGLCIILGS
ncbi:hypothetical protein CUMW_271280 [Citrus unshiu]|uniref:Sieve element occlusion N-terminal domain-containing protein n=1 Tax=Citrus unshiu TaxID=55188 RepID=A0A2H5QXL4_CITUN|nr:hypothetical protein CUMW_271280 [Citrus unshiu]